MGDPRIDRDRDLYTAPCVPLAVCLCVRLAVCSISCLQHRRVRVWRHL